MTRIDLRVGALADPLDEADSRIETGELHHVELAGEDDRLWLVAGDLGYSVLEAFSEKYPQRYLNAGVAEQNMTGIAAGLAMAGKTAFTYSIANFPVFRCLEQVRNDVCYHNLNVKVVAVGGGLAYGSAGYSHHAMEHRSR